MRTFLACMFTLICLVSGTQFLILMISNPPWTMMNHIIACMLLGISLMSCLGMYAMTSLKTKQGRWNHE